MCTSLIGGGFRRGIVRLHDALGQHVGLDLLAADVGQAVIVRVRVRVERVGVHALGSLAGITAIGPSTRIGPLAASFTTRAPSPISIFSPGFLKVTVNSPGCPARRATTVSVFTTILSLASTALIISPTVGSISSA